LNGGEKIKIKLSTILFASSMFLFALISLVVATVIFSFGSQINVPTPNPSASPSPSPTPILTTTFTTSATLNGTAITNPAVINLPTTLHNGDKFIVVYTITNTANQPLTIIRASTSTTITGLTWDKPNLPLAIEATGTLTLTIPIGILAGTINVMFTS
jgi:hypothetical protein